MIKKNRIFALAFFVSIMSINNAQAGWQDWLKTATDQLSDNETVTSAATALLTNDEIGAGLKEALSKGVKSAINTLGQQDGFMKDSSVKIPLPDSLKLVEKTARELGQGQIADQFISTMNHAAEQAVPAAADLLGEAIQQMSVADATEIIKGSNSAATDYFRLQYGPKLAEKFRPIIEQATNQFGVISAYKTLITQAKPLLDNQLFNNPLTSSFMPTDALDVDQYVTDKALDGLFKYIALEEKKIRENPAARSSEILKKVFASS